MKREPPAMTTLALTDWENQLVSSGIWKKYIGQTKAGSDRGFYSNSLNTPQNLLVQNSVSTDCAYHIDFRYSQFLLVVGGRAIGKGAGKYGAGCFVRDIAMGGAAYIRDHVKLIDAAPESLSTRNKDGIMLNGITHGGTWDTSVHPENAGKASDRAPVYILRDYVRRPQDAALDLKYDALIRDSYYQGGREVLKLWRDVQVTAVNTTFIMDDSSYMAVFSTPNSVFRYYNCQFVYKDGRVSDKLDGNIDYQSGSNSSQNIKLTSMPAGFDTPFFTGGAAEPPVEPPV